MRFPLATPVGLALILAGGALILSPGLSPELQEFRIEIPVGLETTQLPSPTPSTGALGVNITPSVIAFGPVGPGNASKSVELNITNTGAVPFRLRLEATALVGVDTGARMLKDMVVFEIGADGEVERPTLTEILLAPGQPVQVQVTLQVPFGTQQWIPADEYQGTIGVILREVPQ